MIFSEIRQIIIKASKSLGWEITSKDFSVQVNRNIRLGEFSSNVAYVISQRFQLSLNETTAKLEQAILQTPNSFARIEVTNGYFNFFYKVSDLNQIIQKILREKNQYGASDIGKNVRVNYEWISANPTGHLHIGHLRNAVVAHCMVNVMLFMGYAVEKEFYVNDAGNQVFNLGKTIFYHYAKKIKKSFPAFPEMYQNSELIALGEKMYAQYGDQYRDLSWKSLDNQSPAQLRFINFGKDYFLQIFRDDSAALGIQFDRWFSEKSLYENGYFERFLNRLKENNLTYTKDGALWFKTSQFGAEVDYVLVRKDGNPTYFAGDLMYHDHKFARGYESIYDLWGGDQHGHFAKVKTGLLGLGWPAEKFHVKFLQTVLVLRDQKTQRMSKRLGTAVYWREFIEFTGKDFARFMMVSRQRNTKFVFDLGLFKEKNAKNPVYYTQYAHARACQILAKRQDQSAFPQIYSQLGQTFSEKDLIVNLYRLPQILPRVLELHEPQLLTDYLIEISKKFHVFYQQNPILQASTKELQEERLGLVAAFRQVAHNIFDLLGVSAPKRM